jgi:signal transduction histidine kinase
MGTAWLRWRAQLSPDRPDTLFVRLGWFDQATIYRQEGNRLQILGQGGRWAASSPTEAALKQTRPIVVGEADTLTLWVAMPAYARQRLRYAPMLYTRAELRQEWATGLAEKRRYLIGYGGLMSLLGFQLIYTLSLAWIAWHPAIRYYAGYLGIMAAFIHLRYAAYLELPGAGYAWGEVGRVLPDLLAFVAYWCYFRFIRQLLLLESQDRWLYRGLGWLAYIALGYAALAGLLVWLPTLRWGSYVLGSVLLLIGALVLQVRLLRQPGATVRWVQLGSLCYLLGMGQGFFRLLWQMLTGREVGAGVDWVAVGLAAEVLCFGLALAYRFREDEREKRAAQAMALARMVENQRLTREMVAARQRLADDLHDDIGATLSTIAFLSEVAQQPGAGTQGISSYLERIAHSARQCAEAMNEVVWTLHPQHDHQLALFHRMEDHARMACMAQGVALHWRVEESLGGLLFAPELQRSLYLVFKEALNNALRHSQATQVWVELTKIEAGLWVCFADNGRGGVQQQGSTGHGLASMRSRVLRSGGSWLLVSSPGEGTSLHLRWPLPDLGEASTPMLP